MVKSMPLITVVGRADVFAALAEVDSAMGADVANMMRAYIVALGAQIEALEAEVERLSGQLMELCHDRMA